MRSIQILVMLVMVAASAGAQGVFPTFKEHDSGDSSNRLDVVIMGDGYTAAQMPLFRAHVTNFINAWLNTAPMSRYKHHVNVWRVEVPSAQSGADHPAPCYSSPVLVNTYFDATYCGGGTQRCILSNTSKVLSTALINVPAYDEVLLVVNDPEYGGCAGTVAHYAGPNGSGLAVAIHELGHSIFGLADEYWNNGTTYSGGELSQPNVTIQNQTQIAQTGTKWSHWIGQESVSAFEGGRYFQFGIFRPRSNCRMRSNGSSFCPVCREETLVDLWNYVDEYDAVNPPPVGNVYSTGTVLSVDLPALGSGSLHATWTVDGTQTSSGTVTNNGSLATYSFDPGTLVTGGSHTVTLNIEDDTTWHRRTPTLEPLPELTWLLTDVFPDYEPDAFDVLQAPLRRGELFQVSDTVANVGSTPGPGFRVGFYLSTDINITTADVFAGSRNVPGLAPGQSHSGTTWCRVPLEAFPGGYHVGVIVDDLAQAIEPVESNNATFDPTYSILDITDTLQITGFVIPFGVAGSATLSLIAGPEHAGESYFVFPSLSPPAGGTDLGAFVGTIPFSFDALSNAVITGVITAPVVQAFSGTLDGSGEATATFFKPALSVPPGTLPIAMQFIFLTLSTDPATGATILPLASNVEGILFY